MILALTCSSFQHCCSSFNASPSSSFLCEMVAKCRSVLKNSQNRDTQSNRGTYLSINCCSVSAMSPSLSSSSPAPSSSLVGASFFHFLCDGSNIEMSLQKEIHHNSPCSYLSFAHGYICILFLIVSSFRLRVPCSTGGDSQWRYLSHHGDHIKKRNLLRRGIGLDVHMPRNPAACCRRNDTRFYRIYIMMYYSYGIVSR